MSPYKKREVQPAELVRTSFGSMDRRRSIVDVIGQHTVGQFTVAVAGIVGLAAVVASQVG
jgi:hypothetical protein